VEVVSLDAWKETCLEVNRILSIAYGFNLLDVAGPSTSGTSQPPNQAQYQQEQKQV